MTEHHRVRRLALQGLCCLDVQGKRAMELVLAFLRDSRERPDTITQAQHVVQQVFSSRDDADKLLAGQSEHWDVSRMALVDRNILRLAVWELLTGRTAKKIVINEALQLAKEFASAESSRFINGVLDAAAKRVRQNFRRESEEPREEQED